MPRPERTLDPTTNPVHAFAADLRTLRQKAGNPTYLKMSRATGKSRTALAEAAGGDHVPRWETVEAYVRACNGVPDDWRCKWEALQEPREQAVASSSPSAADEIDNGITTASNRVKASHRGARRPLIWVGAVASVLAIAVLALTMRSSPGDESAPSPSTTTQPSGPVAIVIQNKVAIGTDFLEDVTPAYLSSKPIPFCGREGCKLEGTEMWSGAVLAVGCSVMGAEMSNVDLSSSGIEQNRHRHTSARWYRAVLPGDRTGFISEVYVEPQYRGGLGLPECSQERP